MYKPTNSTLFLCAQASSCICHSNAGSLTKALPPLHWRQLLIITVMASTNYSTRITLKTATYNVKCTLFQKTGCKFSSPQSKKSLITILVLIKTHTPLIRTPGDSTEHYTRHQGQPQPKWPTAINLHFVATEEEGGDNMTYPVVKLMN
jgi:hypothetical protein